MASRITVAQAARTFSALVDRVRSRGEELVVERAGEAVCRIGPVAPRCTVAELSRRLAELPRPDLAYLDLMERLARRQSKLPRRPGTGHAEAPR